MIISQLNQALYKVLVDLIRNTKDSNQNQIWGLQEKIFMIGYNNNISLPSDNQFILIKRGKIRSLMHQQLAHINYSAKQKSRSGEFTVDIELKVSSTSNNPMGLSLDEAWNQLFYQEVVDSWLTPFSLLNTGQRFNSVAPIYLEIDNGLYVIHNIFYFTLMYRLESMAIYTPYATIETDLNQINRDI